MYSFPLSESRWRKNGEEKSVNITCTGNWAEKFRIFQLLEWLFIVFC